MVSASKAGAEVVLHSYTEQDSHMQEHHVEWSSRTAESAHLLFPEMEITVFFLDLLKSFNCCWIKAPVLTVLFQIPATLFLHWRLHSCGAALHVFTDIIFSPALSCCHNNSSKQEYWLHYRTLSSLLLLHWYHFSNSNRVGLSLLDVKERGIRITVHIKSS